ncbi:MAG: hypothetical protein DWQ19_12640 [Crenarchaeota archaeon]|nr:MAG: hypothetical protein DWQ19_12640 [Thermoproteota archaeon]
MKNYVIENWLEDLMEIETPFAGGQPDAMAGQAPTTDPYGGPLGNIGNMGNTADTSAQNMGDPDIANQDQMQNQAEPEDDVNDDPMVPDMPEEKSEVKDFESWKNDYLKESIKGDTQKLIDMLSMVRDKKGLQPVQKKFVDDNWNVQLIRQNSNVDKASKDIRRNIKDQLDRNNPATSVVNHMSAVLETDPILNNIFIKLDGYGALKGDLHRKYIAALLGGVQVGAGGNTEDVVYNERDYSILLSTRFNYQWGEVMLGSWNMKEDDPDRHLAEPEKKRLEEGSPEEKDVLRRRVILESIVEQFETRAFVVMVVDETGTIYSLGWDIAGSLKTAYTDGRLIVKTSIADNSDAMITDEGELVPFMDLDIYYAKETGEQNEDGSPEVEELPFIEKRNGMLFLIAELKTIQEAATSMQGIVLKEQPYNGNPSDLQVLQKCVYSSYDLLLKSCM